MNTALTGGYGFVILDTFSSLAPEADETKDAAMMMRRMSNLLTSILGTVMLVHPPGWSDSSRTRGGYQFEANADEVLVAQEISKGSDMFTLTRKKVKDGPSGQIFYLVAYPWRGPVSSGRPAPMTPACPCGNASWPCSPTRELLVPPVHRS